MSLPFSSLSGASSPGFGAVQDLEDVKREHTLIISATGAPTGFVVHLEGSHDGSNWVDLGAANESSPVLTVSTHLLRFVRANWTGITGGTSPTVTASIASR